MENDDYVMDLRTDEERNAPEPLPMTEAEIAADRAMWAEAMDAPFAPPPPPRKWEPLPAGARGILAIWRGGILY